MKKKIVAAALACILCIGVGIGGTLAWLADKTESVVNTFTYGNIDITLTETTGSEYKMIPGSTITKDPKVTVKATSEASWLFVKIEKSANYDSYLNGYTVADGWTELSKDSNTAVYYREVPSVSADTEFPVLEDNQVVVLTSVSKTMMDGIKNGTVAKPTLTFTAYAVQKDNIASVNDAWTQAQNTANY